MVKIMLFIDGTWLYSCTPKLADAYGDKDFQVDFGKLPCVLAEEVGKQLGSLDTAVVRTHLFGSYASNVDWRDEEAVYRRLDFFSLLKEEYHYEVEIFPVNFRGRRLRKADRDPRDTFEPKEKCLDISLAASMLFLAAIPYAYDIAVAVVGDQDYKPVLQHVRRLGKRVAIASIKGSCAPEYADPRDEARVKDFDTIWLDDLLHKLVLKFERHQVECQSPIHAGDRKVWTTYRLRKGRKFYCDTCRATFSAQIREAQQEFVGSNLEAIPAEGTDASSKIGMTMAGVVNKKVEDRGFGFIHAADGHDYFFHFTDLQSELDFGTVREGMRVDFDVKKEPTGEKGGAAQNVRQKAQ